MSLKGRYIPDRIVEIPMGEGVTQLVYEPIKVFDWEKPKPMEVITVEPKKRRSRDWIRWSIVVAAFLLGTGLGAILQQMYFAIPLFIASLAWIALVAWVNRR